jgi:type IV pilus assembly protein PilQ
LKDPKHQIRQNGNVVEVVFAKEVAQNLTPAASVAASMPVVDTVPVRSPRGGAGIVSSAPQAKMGNDVVSNEGRYVGRPISLDFSNADIRTVLQVFADFTKMNLVVSDSVQGRLTVHLKDVPWDQALEIVMRSKGLVSSRSGNVLLVSSQTDASSEQLEVATRRAKDDMEPLVSKTFVVSYQKTAEVVNLLKAKDSKLLSSRGTILSDERTSQIFIEDTPSRLERMVDIIRSVDKPVKQVMIEARVVLADTSVSKELGVRVRSASTPSTDFTTVGDAVGKQGFADTGSSVSTTLAYTLLNANSTRLLSIQLKALETENRIHTVSNPRVITSNKELALIEQGTEIPYQIATSSGATATEFKEANLKLEVTPQISPDGSVLLDVNVSKDSIGVTTANGPAIDTRRVKTKVLVTDGGTVVLGGIFEENNNEVDNSVPFLSGIPVLGALFKSKTDSKRKAELLIFLTPVVLKDS